MAAVAAVAAAVAAAARSLELTPAADAVKPWEADSGAVAAEVRGAGALAAAPSAVEVEVAADAAERGLVNVSPAAATLPPLPVDVEGAEVDGASMVGGAVSPLVVGGVGTAT